MEQEEEPSPRGDLHKLTGALERAGERAQSQVDSGQADEAAATEACSAETRPTSAAAQASASPASKAAATEASATQEGTSRSRSGRGPGQARDEESSRRLRAGTAALRLPGRRAGPWSRFPEEQGAIREARKLRRRGLSLRQIGAKLTEGGYRPKGGGDWHPPQVARLLAR